LGTGSFGKTPIITGAPQIIQTQFDNPIVVPAGVERIVTVSKFKNLYDPTVAEILVAGTTVDTGESLYYGCGTQRTTVSTKALAVPVPNANFSSTLLVRLLKKVQE
jgi:hypothetical protein